MKRAPSIDSPADFQWSNNKFPSKKNKIVRSRRSYIGCRSNVMMRKKKKKYTLPRKLKIAYKKCYEIGIPDSILRNASKQMYVTFECITYVFVQIIRIMMEFREWAHIIIQFSNKPISCTF
jgi:hypothetical protein